MGRNTNIKYKNKKDVNYTHCGETFYCQTKRCDKKNTINVMNALCKN